MDWIKTKLKRFWHWVLLTGVVGGIALAQIPSDNLQSLHTLEANYLVKYERYLQVQCDGELVNFLGTEKERTEWEKNVTGYCIDEYKEPPSRGGERGYTIKWEDADNKYADGVGPLKTSRDYTILKPIYTASSTPVSSMFLDFFAFLKPVAVFAADNTQTHATDLELDSSQRWSITHASQTGLGITGSLSIALWVKPESLNNPVVVSKACNFGGGDFRGYHLQILSSANQMRFNIDNVNFPDDTTSGDYNLTLGTWVHLAVTYDTTNTRFYKNGSLTDTIGSADGALQDSLNPFIIGANTVGTCSSGIESLYDGGIDDVAIFSRKLTDTEVSNVFTTPCTLGGLGADGSLEGWWHFNNEAGVDQTGNDNDLTNNNTATFQSADLPFECVAAGAEVHNLKIRTIGM